MEERLSQDEQLQLENALFGFPETIEGAFRMYQACDAWSKRLAQRSKGLRKFLRDAIPSEIDNLPEDVSGADVEKVIVDKEGVSRAVWYQQSVKYKDALSDIKDELIPKTRHERADEIVDSYTTFTLRDKFTEIKD